MSRLNKDGFPAFYDQRWVKRKVIKQDGTKGHCSDHRQESDPACWRKANKQGDNPMMGRKFAGGSPRVGSMHLPHKIIMG